jgi:hypothetical protein
LRRVRARWIPARENGKSDDAELESPIDKIISDKLSKPFIVAKLAFKPSAFSASISAIVLAKKLRRPSHKRSNGYSSASASVFARFRGADSIDIDRQVRRSRICLKLFVQQLRLLLYLIDQRVTFVFGHLRRLLFAMD